MDSSNESAHNLTQAPLSPFTETEIRSLILDYESRLNSFEDSLLALSHMGLISDAWLTILLEDAQHLLRRCSVAIRTHHFSSTPSATSSQKKVNALRKSNLKSLATCPPTNSRRMKR